MMPAYFANMAPVIVKNLFKFLAIPIDLNKKINNKPMFGKNKTFRGLIFGVLFAIVIGFVQFILYRFDFFKNISFFDYSNWLIFGFLMGFGAIFGDLIESFFKRRLNIKPGQSFVPWDQLDFVIGALISVYFVFRFDFKILITACLISFLSHVIINHMSFYLKFRDTKW